MLKLVHKNELLVKNKKFIKNEIIKSSKHFPCSTREWKNSIYVFNKNSLNLIPFTSITCLNIIKSYFSLYNKNIEKKIRKKRIKLKFRRFSSNKIYISNGEFKHTNNKIIINLYLFNRQKKNYTTAIKKKKKLLIKKWNRVNYLITNRLRIEKRKSIFSIKKKLKRKLIRRINNKKLSFLKDYFFLHIHKNKINYYISFYIENFIDNYIETTKNKLLLYCYYKQLIFINESKYNYTYLQYLKEQLYKLYNKEVEFNLINIKRFYLNSDILSESITKKITRRRRKITRYLINLKNKVLVKKSKILTPKYQINSKLDNKKNLTKSTKKLETTIFKNLKYKRITGFRLEANGRLTKRNTASRSVKRVSFKGNLLNLDSSLEGLSTVLLKGNLKSNVQYTKLASKSGIGSFGIKGWVSSN